MGDKVKIVYKGKEYTGYIKSIEAFVKEVRYIESKLKISTIVGYEVELFDEISNAIIHLQVERFSDIKVCEKGE